MGRLSGTTFEYDATVAASIHATGSNVTSWDDQSGNGHNTTGVDSTPKTGTRTLGGLNSIEFGHTATECLFWSGAVTPSPYTVYAVIQLDSVPAHAEFLNMNGVEAGVIGSVWGISGGSVISGGTPNTQPHVYTGLFNSTSSKVFIDSVQVASGDAGTTTPTTPAIGGDGGTINWPGLISFLALVPSAASDPTRLANEALLTAAFLNARYTIPGLFDNRAL